jgi:hypothetical protein
VLLGGIEGLSPFVQQDTSPFLPHNPHVDSAVAAFFFSRDKVVKPCLGDGRIYLTPCMAMLSDVALKLP